MMPLNVRSNFSDLYGSGALPVLDELFMSELEMHPSRRGQLFNVIPWDRDIAQYTETHDLGLFREIAEGAEYSLDKTKQGARKTYEMVKFGLGFSISDEMIDDGKFDVMGDLTRKLAKSGRESQEISAMNVFNNGFGSETTADGVAVFSTAHTLPSGGTFRNRPTTGSDLSESSLQTAMSDFETIFVGDSGIIYKPVPKILLVHPRNRRYAQELVGSDLKADTADNNMNSLKQDGLQVISSPHLTDEDAWFVLAAPEQTSLVIYERKALETKAAGPDVGFMTDSIVYKARYREDVGCSNGYNIYGNPGV